MNKNCQKILELILGEEDCKELITKAVKEYNQGAYSLNNFEIIMDSYFVAILLIGFSKKKVEIDKYAIHLMNKPDINIDAKWFCEEYKKYIDKVEKYKFDLLRELISDKTDKEAKYEE